MLSVVAFVALYFAAVRTYLGQYIENSVLLGAKQQPRPELLDSLETLHTISLGSLALALVIIVVIGFARKAPRVAVGSALIIVVSTGVTEVLKRYVLPRPDLATIYENNAHNSFPSGHTTIGMAIVIALLVVSAYRFRGWVMFFTLIWGTSMAAATITASWHRLSDTIGANLVVLTVGSLVVLWLRKNGNLRREVDHSYPLRGIFYAVVALLGAAALAVGLYVGIMTVNLWELPTLVEAARAAGVSPNLTAHQNPTFTWNLFVAAQSVALGFSLLSSLLFWATFHHLGTGRTASHGEPNAVVFTR